MAAADLANWKDLKECIQGQDQTAEEKSVLLQRLEQLAERREESRAGALESLKAKKEEATHVAEEEARYQSLLDEEGRRLERYNPVGPRRDRALITTNRLEADIAAGKGIWQSRREHRARERAARHRMDQRAAGVLVPPRDAAGTLPVVRPEEHGEALNEQMRARAKEEVRDFRRELKEEAMQGQASRSKRQKDSARRKKVKKERRKERKRNSRDDAERDSNHAIAHSSRGAGSRYATGFLVAAATVARANAESEPPEERAWDVGGWAVWCLFGTLAALVIHRMAHKKRETSKNRRVGARKKRVKFEDAVQKGVGSYQNISVPFMGGPQTAARLHPAGQALRFSEIQGREEWKQESLALLVDRYAKSTIRGLQEPVQMVGTFLHSAGYRSHPNQSGVQQGGGANLFGFHLALCP